MIKKHKCLITLIVILLLASATLHAYVNNFHVVIANKYYRSNQLNEPDFISAINKYHIKTIINLRGHNPDQDWYQNEMKAVAATKVQHEDIALSSKSLPTPQQLQQLVSLIQNAPQPILVHCENGADRSGFASALIIILNNGSIDNAEKQASFRYFVFSHKSIGKQFLRNYQAWLANKHLQNSPQSLLLWVKEYNT